MHKGRASELWRPCAEKTQSLRRMILHIEKLRQEKESEARQDYKQGAEHERPVIGFSVLVFSFGRFCVEFFIWLLAALRSGD